MNFCLTDDQKRIRPRIHRLTTWQAVKRRRLKAFLSWPFYWQHRPSDRSTKSVSQYMKAFECLCVCDMKTRNNPKIVDRVWAKLTHGMHSDVRSQTKCAILQCRWNRHIAPQSTQCKWWLSIIMEYMEKWRWWSLTSLTVVVYAFGQITLYTVWN